MSRAYELSHVVGFEETNVMGNVYYANHVRWQGRCREMFLKDHCPELLRVCPDLRLVTLSCSCEYLAELFPFDEVVIRMSLAECTRSRFTMAFEYWRREADERRLVARGRQRVGCMADGPEGIAPTPIPDPLRNALLAYMPESAAMPRTTTPTP